jgi:L-aminopeptidase/D-esterase-like protein
MKSLSIGHFTNADLGTGLTVFLFDQPARAAYCIPGSSPATRELHILEPDSNVEHIDALMLTGGSAYGLGAANGVMQWLQEKGQGKKMPHGGVVPIVAAAAIYDMAFKAAAAPTIDEAYQACKQAKQNNPIQGRHGVGTGATIGKLVQKAMRMSGGLGMAEIKLNNGLEVIAYAAVNAVGDIRDASNHIIAGAKLPNGSFADCRDYLLAGNSNKTSHEENTTLVALFTNASFSQIELKRIAKMATAGMAQAISPVFTQYDGDIIFCISLGDFKAEELIVGTMAVEAVRKAILNAVSESVEIQL